MYTFGETNIRQLLKLCPFVLCVHVCIYRCMGICVSLCMYLCMCVCVCTEEDSTTANLLKMGEMLQLNGLSRYFIPSGGVREYLSSDRVTLPSHCIRKGLRMFATTLGTLLD